MEHLSVIMLKKIIKVIGLILVILGVTLPLGYKGLDIANVYLNEEKITEKKETKDYYAILEIPFINLKRELFPLNNSENNVNKNLFVHEISTFPHSLDTSSNLIIAGHSGNGLNAYFKNLYKLSVGHKVFLYYNDNLYTYEIKEIEYQNKTGTLYLKHDYTNELVLITCTKNNKNTQTIYYASLLNIEKLSL